MFTCWNNAGKDQFLRIVASYTLHSVSEELLAYAVTYSLSSLSDNMPSQEEVNDNNFMISNPYYHMMNLH